MEQQNRKKNAMQTTLFKELQSLQHGIFSMYLKCYTNQGTFAKWMKAYGYWLLNLLYIGNVRQGFRQMRNLERT